MTNVDIESQAARFGGKWNGDAWVFEGADLHTFARHLVAEANADIKYLNDALKICNSKSEHLKTEYYLCGNQIALLRRALHNIAEEWALSECGEPVYAQEAYAIGVAKRMYSLAIECLKSAMNHDAKQLKFRRLRRNDVCLL